MAQRKQFENSEKVFVLSGEKLAISTNCEAVICEEKLYLNTVRLLCLHRLKLSFSQNI